MQIIGKVLMKLIGWSIDFNLPEGSNRCVVIAAPHTSNWDGIIMRIAFAGLGIPFKFAVKDSLTKFPFGLIVKPFGGLGINRSKPKEGEKRLSQIEQMANFFKQREILALAIAPEGTRSLREEWKMGFYYVAKMANVPITFGYLDYKRKIAGLGGVMHPSEDMEADLRKVMAFYKDIAPKFPEKYSLDKRYV